MARLVLDTNSLIQCISHRSPYHELWLSFLDGRNELCVSFLVGIAGLEPATSRPPDVCATNCAKSRSFAEQFSNLPIGIACCGGNVVSHFDASMFYYCCGL